MQHVELCDTALSDRHLYMFILITKVCTFLSVQKFYFFVFKIWHVHPHENFIFEI